MGIRERRWEAGGKQKRAWIVDYIGTDGQRHIRTCATRSLAERYWASMLAQKPPRHELDIVIDWLRTNSSMYVARRLADELSQLAKGEG